jgi:hypothetical protein
MTGRIKATPILAVCDDRRSLSSFVEKLLTEWLSLKPYLPGGKPAQGRLEV